MICVGSVSSWQLVQDAPRLHPRQQASARAPEGREDKRFEHGWMDGWLGALTAVPKHACLTGCTSMQKHSEDCVCQ